MDNLTSYVQSITIDSCYQCYIAMSLDQIYPDGRVDTIYLSPFDYLKNDCIESLL